MIRKNFERGYAVPISNDRLQNKKTAGRVSLVLAAVFWGLAGVCVKSIDPSWDAMCKIAVRSVLSLVILFIIKGDFHIHFGKTNMIGAVFSSATGILYVAAIPLTTAGTAIVLQYIAPILVFLVAVFFGHRKVRISEILITLLVFSGIVLSFVDSLDMKSVVGNLLALLSGFTFAGQIIYMNKEDADAGDSLIISNLLCLLVSLPFFFVKLGGGALSFDTKSLLWLGVLGLFQYGAANALFGYGIQKVDNVEASLILTIEPIFNPIPVALLGIESMGVTAIAGSAIVILGVTAFTLLPVIDGKIKARKTASPKKE